jgi:hypothetical protein
LWIFPRIGELRRGLFKTTTDFTLTQGLPTEFFGNVDCCGPLAVLLDPYAFPENRVRRCPTIDPSPVVPDLKAITVDRLYQVEIFPPVDLAHMPQAPSLGLRRGPQLAQANRP